MTQLHLILIILLLSCSPLLWYTSLNNAAKTYFVATFLLLSMMIWYYIVPTYVMGYSSHVSSLPKARVQSVVVEEDVAVYYLLQLPEGPRLFSVDYSKEAARESAEVEEMLSNEYIVVTKSAARDISEEYEETTSGGFVAVKTVLPAK